MNQVFTVFIWLLTLSGVSVDPYEILKKASEACKNLDRVEYDVIINQGEVNVVANVVQQAANVKDVGFGQTKILVSGTLKQPDQEESFQFSYDGVFFKLKKNKGIKTIENPTERAIGSTLGLFYYLVVGNYYADPSGLDEIINDLDKAEYIGEELVEGNGAYGIEVTRSYTNPATQQVSSSSTIWYFDKASFLPVKLKGTRLEKTTTIKSVSVKSQDTFDVNSEKMFEELKVTGNEPKTEGLLKIGEQLPSFYLKNFKGDELSLKELSGKVFLIDFWGTWCGPCLLAMPDLQKIHDKYKSKGLTVVGISVMDKKGKPQAYVKSKGYNYTFLVNGDDYARKLNLNTFPTIFIVDKNGVILHAEKGRRHSAKAEFEAIIEKYLDR